MYLYAVCVWNLRRYDNRGPVPMEDILNLETADDLVDEKHDAKGLTQAGGTMGLSSSKGILCNKNSPTSLQDAVKPDDLEPVGEARNRSDRMDYLLMLESF